MKTINDAAQEYAINKHEGCTGIIEDTLVDFKAGALNLPSDGYL